MKPQSYIISLGSNVGDSPAILSGALSVLAKNERISIQKTSSFYRTKPWGKTDQPDFLNAVAKLTFTGAPEDLMKLLLAVEKQFGRTRKVHWGPRTLDLDLIYGWGVTSDTALLHLPHPYFWERAFVLVPLAEIEPDFQYRGLKIQERILELHGNEEVAADRPGLNHQSKLVPGD